MLCVCHTYGLSFGERIAHREKKKKERWRLTKSELCKSCVGSGLVVHDLWSGLRAPVSYLVYQAQGGKVDRATIGYERRREE